MALTTPILLTTVAFDATQDHKIKFNVIGGSQVVKNKLVIRDNVTNEIVYTNTQETFRYEHNIKANSLKNGMYYNAVVFTLDAQGNESEPSNPIQFWCYSAPNISFTNIPVGNIIPNASYNFAFEYTQAEGEKLNSYVMNLYTDELSLISTSGIKYVKNGNSPYQGIYLFSGFDNNTAYYIELKGITVNGTEVSTGKIEITVSYTKPDIFTLMELVNNCKEGYISIKSNIILAEGKSNPDPPKYIEDKEVDLTAMDSWVEFDDGYEILNDFYMRAWFRQPNAYKDIIQFSNTKGQSITLRFMQGYEDEEETMFKAYVDIRVDSIQGENYYIYSNYIDILPDTGYYVVGLKRINNIYSLELTSM